MGLTLYKDIEKGSSMGERTMTMKNTGLIVLGVILVLFLGIGVISVGVYFSYHNRFVTMEEDVNGQWAQVENVLQRRADLIPNLVSTVKGYAKHESDVFTNIADARSRLAGARTVEDTAQAVGGFESALSRLLVVVERYPDLKANEQFAGLRDELAGSENRLAVERMRYNELVRNYNAQIRRFPGSIIAGMMNLERRAFFEAAESANEVPKVDF